MRHVGILAYDGVYASAVASVLDVVSMANRRGLARLLENDPEAETRFSPWKATILARGVGEIAAAGGASVAATASIEDWSDGLSAVVVPPFEIDCAEALALRLSQLEPEMCWLRRQHARAALLVANYTGVFVLAEAGVLTDATATVPFTLERLFRARYPRLRLDLSRSIADAEKVICAAALGAGYQLAWQIVEKFTSAVVAQRLFHDLFFETGSAPGAVAQSAASHGDALIERAQTWLAHHLATSVTLAELAQFTNVSPRTLLRRFHETLGLSPLEYLRRIRLETAQRGLELTRFRVEKIAQGVGYEDAAFFTQLFKAHTGLTPSAYRRKFAQPSPYARPRALGRSRRARTAGAP